MTLSVFCPVCGKQFRNIKAEMIGKKARCTCGNILRIVDAFANQVEPDKPLDLLGVDLLGDDMLGEELMRDAKIRERALDESGPYSQDDVMIHDPFSAATQPSQINPVEIVDDVEIVGESDKPR